MQLVYKMAAQQLLFPLPAATGKKESKRKSPDLQRIKVDHELAKGRYYCHRRLKGIFPIDPAKRIVDASPYRSIDEIPVRHRKYVSDLIDYGYNVQLLIPCLKILKPKKTETRKRKARGTRAGKTS